MRNIVYYVFCTLNTKFKLQSMFLCAPRVHTKYKVLCEHNARNYKSNSEFEFYICINLISQKIIDVIIRKYLLR